MTRKPYVGVAGFMTTNEIMAAIETVPERSSHVLAIGILTSAKTLRGDTNKYPNRYPKAADIEGIVRGVREQFNDERVEIHLHYAVESATTMCAELEVVQKLLTSVDFDGVQVNLAPHMIEDADFSPLYTARNNEDIDRVIVQIRPPREGEPFVDLIGAAVDAAGWQCVSDILLDCSGGRGAPLDLIWSSMMIHSFRVARGTGRNDVGIGVAGGLGPTKLFPVYGLLCNHGPLNFDCESGVRDHRDQMSIPVLQAYLREAWEMLALHST